MASKSKDTNSDNNTASCATCGKENADSKCSKCKMVYYCSSECQQKDWQSHKETCFPFRQGVALCDVCNATQEVEHNCCQCGTLYCTPCLEKEKPVKCMGCEKPMAKVCRLDREENLRALEALVDEESDDKRRGYWCIVIAQMYLYGITGTGVEEDWEKAKLYAELAGSLGYAEGYNFLGARCVEEGRWEEGKEWWEKATAMQFAVSFTNMGKSFYGGSFGGHVDYAAAETMFRKGLKLGDIDSCYMLGLMHANGQGVPMSKKKAVKFYQKAAEKGEPHSLLNLGVCYAYGNGVPQSYATARQWWEKAASQQKEPGTAQNAKDNLRMLDQGGYY